MKTTNRGAVKSIQASATGCDVVDAKLTTWENLPNEAYRGQCAQLKVGTLRALGFEQSDNALEALAVQLEALARKVRGMKGSK